MAIGHAPARQLRTALCIAAKAVGLAPARRGDGYRAAGDKAAKQWQCQLRPRGPDRYLRQLLLLRHAKSSWDDPRLSDHVRPLSPRGRKAAAALREAMQKLSLSPDVVLVSSARRTLQTLEALLPWPETPIIEPMDALYLATAPQLLAVLNTNVAETVRSLLLVGHNPGLHELAQTLAGSARAPEDAARLAASYPTAALAEFAVPGPWRTLGPGGARLVRFVCPRDLPLPA